MCSYFVYYLNINHFVGGEDYHYQNYTFIFQEGETEKKLTINPIDDNFVEANETYTLVIVDPPHSRVNVGENGTATITIYNDDGKEMYDKKHSEVSSVVIIFS